MSPKVGVGVGLRLREKRFSESLDMGAVIMRGFSGESRRGIADVADALQANRSTVHRYMVTLTALGMLEQEPATRLYKLGSSPMDMGRDALEPHRTVKALGSELRALRRKTGCVVRAGVLVGPDVLIVGCERSLTEGQGLLGTQLRRGGRVPAHCTALGKVLLSALDATDLRKLLSDAELAKLTPKTVTGKRALVAAASEAAQRGYAVEAEEHEERVFGIAAPVLDADGVTAAALSLVGRAPEMAMKGLEGHLDALRASAGRIGGRMERAPVTRRPGPVE